MWATQNHLFVWLWDCVCVCTRSLFLLFKCKVQVRRRTWSKTHQCKFQGIFHVKKRCSKIHTKIYHHSDNQLLKKHLKKKSSVKIFCVASGIYIYIRNFDNNNNNNLNYLFTFGSDSFQYYNNYCHSSVNVGNRSYYI